MATVLALTLTLGLLASPAQTGAALEPAPPSSGPRDPPPGTPADRKLWTAARDVSNALVAEQNVASDLTFQAKRGQYLERLRDPARRGAVPAEEAEALARRLEAKWLSSVILMQSQWPVSKTRGCQYEMINLGAVMYAGAPEKHEARLREVRAATQDCVARAEKVRAEARGTSQELRETIAEAHRAVGPPAAPAPAAGAASAAPAAPAVPASTAPAAPAPR
jgi:hypothetical protein